MLHPPDKSPATNSAIPSKNTIVLSWAAILLSGCVVFFGNLRFGASVLAVGFEDDFFYYAQIARNLALHGESTFDGIHRTNGYHPLWFLILTAVTKLFGIGGLFRATTVYPFAIALESLQLAILLGIGWFALKLCRQFCSDVVSSCILLLLSSFSLVLVRTGMEVGLSLFFGFVLLWFRMRPAFRWTLADSYRYGFLASGFILSRLDGVLFVGLLVAFDLAPLVLSKLISPSRALAFCVGLSPVALYVLMNVVVFRTATPVSGMAKQMRLHHHTPSLVALRSFVDAMHALGSPLLAPCVVLTAVALVLATARAARGHLPGRKVLYAMLLFAPVQLLATTCLSDWKLWPWYVYPWLLSATVGACVLFAQQPVNVSHPISPTAKTCFVFSLVFLVGYSFAIAYRSNPQHNLTWVAGLEITQFAAHHPGIYAMGDRSGAAGYLMPQPVLQLEGLVMDKDYLANIKNQRDLISTLSHYKVDYYISTRALQDPMGCYIVKEPWQAGPDSPSMHGRICKVPIAEFSHNFFTNDIFDLHQGTVP